jgi:RNA polymerase sigma factor (TIGR02999 family)
MLTALQEGESDVEDKLFKRLYTRFRETARGQRRQWKGDPSLRTTALAHEAYVKLVENEAQSWENRSHFMAVAARAMRHILINEAKRKHRQKRGGETSPMSLDELRESLGREVALTEERAEVLVVLDEALELLENERPRAARVVECRFFVGMTIEETAEALDVSGSTVSRDWTLAQSWLYRTMKEIRGETDAEDDDES